MRWRDFISMTAPVVPSHWRPGQSRRKSHAARPWLRANRVNRRVVILLLATMVPWLGGADAQTPRVVALVLPTAPLAQITGPNPVLPPARAFVHGLHDLGWIEGETVTIERHSAEGDPERAATILAEIASRDVDVVVLGGAQWLHEKARLAMPNTPIVAIFASDPVASGLVSSISRPGANITGVSTSTGSELYRKRHQLLQELAPAMSRAALLGTQEGWDSYVADLGAADGSLIFVPFNNSGRIADSLATVLHERADGLVLQGGPAAYVHARTLVEFSAANRLPAIYPFREAVESGGLISYGPSVTGFFRQLAGFTDRILRGSQPGDLPIEQPAELEMIVNAATARELGLVIPETIMVRADEVIE